MMEFYSEQERKAQKEHICEFCGKAIQRGIKYYRATGKYDGAFFDRKLHVQCHLKEIEYCREADGETTLELVEV